MGGGEGASEVVGLVVVGCAAVGWGCGVEGGVEVLVDGEAVGGCKGAGESEVVNLYVSIWCRRATPLM